MTAPESSAPVSPAAETLRTADVDAIPILKTAAYLAQDEGLNGTADLLYSLVEGRRTIGNVEAICRTIETQIETHQGYIRRRAGARSVSGLERAIELMRMVRDQLRGFNADGSTRAT